MCGIVAFLGKTSGSKQCLDGIKMLQNRGYDSCGACGINNNEFKLSKFASIDNGESAVSLLENNYNDFQNSEILCLHTRWATTGAKTDINAHPHIDMTNKICIVHNGIIENYRELKQNLIAKGFEFKSQTDSEVIANLIGFNYDSTIGMGLGIEESIKESLNMLEGTWGLVIMCLDTPNKLYCARHGSPLLIGFCDDYYMIASEQSGFSHYVDNYVCVSDGDFIVLDKNSNIKSKFIQSNIKKVIKSDIQLSPHPFKFWTLKEIHEQSDSSIRALGNGGRISDGGVRLGGLFKFKKELEGIHNLVLLGCGTSYNSGLYSLSIFKKICSFNTVQLFDGGEFTTNDIPRNSGKTGIIFISQSGETKDLHRCLEMIKNLDVITIGVINVVDSLIAREVHCGVYLNAGREVGVASTKAFTSQVIVLYLIACWFSQLNDTHKFQRMSIIENLRKVPLNIGSVIESVSPIAEEIARYLVGYHSLFILGKNISYAVACEGSLKIKEIGYIHADGYSSTSLKHGSYAILDNGFPVILITPNDDFFVRNDSIAEELKARNSFLIGISDRDLDDKYDVKIKVPSCGDFTGLMCNVILQLIGYYVAIEKGHNVDQPKHLAKCCNVD